MPSITRTNSPGLIAQAELSSYHEQGFLILPQFFSAEELDPIEHAIEEPESEAYFHNGSSFIFSLLQKNPLFQELGRNPRLLDIIGQIVYPGIAVYSAKMLSKTPGDQSTCLWHQDESYYAMVVRAAHRMSAWIPLQDTDEHNGGLVVVPGSHKKGLRPWTAREQASAQCHLEINDASQIKEKDCVPVRMRRGDCLLFDSLLWHTSGVNNSQRPRRAFIVSYQEATVERGNGDQHEILRPA